MKKAGGIRQNRDFGQGPVWKNILSQAVPLMIAQLVHLLYNIVDRIYIGHMETGSSMALTGVGLTFPVVSLIMAFAALFGIGGVPLFSIARGAGETDRAARIMGNSLSLLLISGGLLTAAGYLFSRPVLFAFGASEDSYVYAGEYLRLYLAGTVFSMISTGMNGYINAQGYPRVGMLSIVIGAAVNIALDPLFIFVFHMGVSGAALATVISQAVSAVWILLFLVRPDIPVSLNSRSIRPDRGIAKEIAKLGTASFIMQGTNCLVQVVCNSTLQLYGGDVFVGVMTVTNSVREIFMLPASGLTGGAQPVISFNYGAKKYRRSMEGINFTAVISASYTLLAWLVVFAFPGIWFGVFSSDPQLMEQGTDMLRIYFFGFVFMALQTSGQTAFQALGDAPHAIFFSLLRKAIIVTPLTLLLPRMGFGVRGVFLAEPISNIIGGLACFLTMRMTAYRRLSREAASPALPDMRKE